MMTEGELSKSEETAAPMEKSSPAELLKRKAELELVKEEADRREKEAKIEDKEKSAEVESFEWISKHLKAEALHGGRIPDWGEDSFNDLEYSTSDELKALSDDDDEFRSKLKGWNEDYVKLKHQLIQTKGFGGDPKLEPYEGVGFRKIRHNPHLDSCVQVNPNITLREFFREVIDVCLKELNTRNANDDSKPKVPKVEFVSFVRGNYRTGRTTTSYVTFMAREKPDGPPVEYQAKCMVTMHQERHPIFCRRAPTI